MRILLMVFFWLALSSFQPEEIEMADSLRQNGLIYIVVAIVVVIVLGLVFYLYTLDRKITQIENKIKETEKD